MHEHNTTAGVDLIKWTETAQTLSCLYNNNNKNNNKSQKEVR